MANRTDWAAYIGERLIREGHAPDHHRDAIDELAAHLADVCRAAQASGADAAAAERAAEAELDEMGPLGPALTRRRSGPKPPPMWRGMRDDFRQALRALIRRRGFSAAVFVTLTLGIAVNTATFSFVNALLVRDMPYRDPSRLAFMWSKLAWVGVPRAWVAGPHIPKLKREASTIEDIAAIRTNTDHLTSGGDPQLVRSGITSANLFDVLGVRPMLGRGFVKADEPLNVTIMTHDLWQRRFGGDPSIIGKHIEVSGLQMEVIGVLPASFHFQVHSSLGDPLSADLWMPTDWGLEKRPDGNFAFAALVRVKPGATLAQAQSELDRIGGELDRVRFKSRGFGWQLIGVREDLVKGSRSTLLLVAAGAGFLLLVISANVAGLVLVRNADRRREFAVRAALGASRWQIGRLILLECLTLAAAAGAAGTGLAWMAVRAIVATNAVPLPRLAEVNLDWRVIAFTTVVSLGTGLIFGMAPALGTRADHDPLKDASRGSSARTPWMRGVLVAGELAVASLLIAGAVLLVRSYTAILRVDPGFNSAGVLTARLTLDQSRYPDAASAIAVEEKYAARVAAIPGVTASGATSSIPLVGDTDQAAVRAVGVTRPTDEPIVSDIIRSTPGYLRAMGITLLAGRDFTRADREGTAPVAIVDERFARTAWPDGNAVGREITIDGGKPVTVVGLVRHARQYHIERDDREQLYRPFAQDAVGTLFVTLRGNQDPVRLIAPLRAAVADVDPKQPLADVHAIGEVVAEALSARRLQLTVLGSFAAGAALLAAFGVYGILSSIVASRTREIGIRIALGASGSLVRALVLRDVFVLAGIGTAVGLAAAFAGSKLIAHLLFGVSPHDPMSFGITAAGLVAAALAAAYFPARRASRVDPAVTLRADA
jgi:putative ABC transport system permease protein